jgi:hypothetical protein
MFGRFERSSRRLKHWSTVPFTVPLADDEVDHEFAAGTGLPSYSRENGKMATAVPEMVRASEDWTGLQVDPELVLQWLNKKPDWDTPLPDTIGYFIVPAVSFIEPFSPETGEGEVLRLRLTSGITISVQRRGLMFFSFREWIAPPLKNEEASGFDRRAKRQLQRLEVLNAHLACLHSALSAVQQIAIEKLEVSPRDVIVRSDDDFDRAAGMAGSGTLLLEWHRRLPIPGLTISKAALLSSFQILDDILTKHPEALELVALLSRAATDYENHNYAQAVVTAWTIAERLVRKKWSQYLDGQQRNEVVGGTSRPFLNGKRREKLLGADFTASIVSEFLSLDGHLPFELFLQLNQARSSRNAWLHEGHSPGRSGAEAAVVSAQKALAHFTGIRLEIPLISRLTY